MEGGLVTFPLDRIITRPCPKLDMLTASTSGGGNHVVFLSGANLKAHVFPCIILVQTNSANKEPTVLISFYSAHETTRSPPSQ